MRGCVLAMQHQRLLTGLLSARGIFYPDMLAYADYGFQRPSDLATPFWSA